MNKYFRVQNTGFTNGQSWFPVGHRCETFEEAKKLYQISKWDDDCVKWRIVEITFTRYFEDESNLAQETKRITQERYLYL